MTEHSEKNQLVATWDLTLKDVGQDVETLRQWLYNNASKWVFQRERGKSSDYVHFQMRVRFKERMRKSKLIKFLRETPLEGAHVSVTSSGGTKSFSYVMKDDTRMEGPWRDDEYEPRVPLPWQFRVAQEYKWQQDIRASILAQKDEKTFRKREINMIITPNGNAGRSTIAGILQNEGVALAVPPLDDLKAMMGFVASFPPRLGYIFDMPKSIGQRALREFYAGIETLKNGYVFETRYKGQLKMINSPAIWIFTNVEPKVKRLSMDRWKLWEIDPEWQILRAINIEDLAARQENPSNYDMGVLEGASLRSAVTIDPHSEEDQVL